MKYSEFSNRNLNKPLEVDVSTVVITNNCHRNNSAITNDYFFGKNNRIKPITDHGFI